MPAQSPNRCSASEFADEGVKAALIADEPDVFFTTPHFNGYPAVLVRLERIPLPEPAELIEDAWRLRAPKLLLAEFDRQKPLMGAPSSRLVPAENPRPRTSRTCPQADPQRAPVKWR